MRARSLLILLIAYVAVGCGRNAPPLNLGDAYSSSTNTNSATSTSQNTSVATATLTGTSTATSTGTTTSTGSGTGTRGLDSANPADSCRDVLAQGQLSGTYWVRVNTFNGTQVTQVYCEQSLQQGGWMMIYNSVGSSQTLPFWNIPYASRLSRKGTPNINQNFYDGGLYYGVTQFLDYVVDLSGNGAVLMVANGGNFDSQTMRFGLAQFISGDQTVFQSQFAGGWASADYDGDTDSSGNCAVFNSNVTQHYSNCWVYNLGSDAEAPYADANWGPHVRKDTLGPLNLSGDGSFYSRVTRITRFAR